MSTPSSASLSPADLARYSRHLALREIGVQGQEKLKAAKVLLVGAGGLGSPAALYLAASGVGTIGVIDNDRVDSMLREYGLEAGLNRLAASA